MKSCRRGRHRNLNKSQSLVCQPILNHINRPSPKLSSSLSCISRRSSSRLETSVMKSSSESMLRVVVVGITKTEPFFLSERGTSLLSLSLLFSNDACEDCSPSSWTETLRSSRSVLLGPDRGPGPDLDPDLVALGILLRPLSLSFGVVVVSVFVAASSAAFLFLVVGGVVKVFLGLSGRSARGSEEGMAICKVEERGKERKEYLYSYSFCL